MYELKHIMAQTGRRKYVLNLLNVLHKNVTEEYKTDQFLHVIYWLLIYKSNLGHFFRNEGIFFLSSSSSSSSSTNFLCTDLACWSGACRCCPPQYAHVCAHVWHMLFPSPRMCTRRGVGSCRPWVGGMEFSLIHLCDVPHLRLKIGTEGW